jgi:oligopeptidase A
MSQNPLLQRSDLPPFGQIKVEHMEPAVAQTLKNLEQKFQQLEDSIDEQFVATWDTLMEPLDEMDLKLFRVWSPISHLMGVMNSDELRAIYDKMQPEIIKFGLKTSQSKKIYKTLSQMKSNPAWVKLTRPRQRIIERNLLSMTLSGVGLEGSQKERYNAIAQELAALKTKFSNNALDSTKSWSMTLSAKEDIAGIPDHALALASQLYNRTNNTDASTPDAGPWRFTQDAPSYVPFIENSKRRDLREKIYRARIALASHGDFDNSPIISKILVLRQEQAKLLGFESYAAQSLTSKMAGKVDAVDQLLNELLEASITAGKREHSELEAFARSIGHTDALLEWDIPYYAERMKEQLYQFKDEDLRPYFPIDKVLKGMFALVETLFSVKVTESTGTAPIWHKDVKFFKVFDGDSKNHIASFFLDPYARPGLKRAGAWMDDCVNRRKQGVDVEIPVAHLVCNGTPPVGDQPGLMGFDEVHTLFHEFGHGLQHMLTVVDEGAASGINGVEWDAVELASQFMENWLYHKPVLNTISGHFANNQALPQELVEKILAARNYRAASMMLRQLHFGLTDMELHHRHRGQGEETPHEVFNRIGKKTSVLPPRPENRFLCSFSHIFSGGYSAGYYSYKWAEVLSADAFAAFEEAGLENVDALKKTGRRYRDTILALGGGEHPMDVFVKFRGRQPSTTPLLRHSGLV